MKRKTIIVREFTRTLWVGIGIIILDIGIVIDEHFHPTPPADSTYLTFWAATLIWPFVLLFVVIKSLKNKGKIEISDEYIYATYPNRIEKGYVDLSIQVYYSLYVDDRTKYILVSNHPIVLDMWTVFTDIDYSSQIPILYTKRVQKLFPKDDWIEVVLPKAGA